MSWTVKQLVDHVSRRTERRADGKIDLRMEFFLGLDEFVNERHFWWRKKRGSFTTVIGSQIYDLSASAVNGNIQAGGGLTDYSQLDEMILLAADGITKQADLTPIIDPIAQMAALNQNTQDTPAAYFIDVNTSLTTLYFQAPANVAQKVLYTYWATPQVNDTTKDAIPMIPPDCQWGLTYMLERRVYEFLYGQDDPRWTVANNRYQDLILKASRIKHWSGKKVVEASVGGGVISVARAWQGS